MFPGDENTRRRALVSAAGAWAAGGVDCIQIREKDLPPPELLRLARAVAEAVRPVASATKLLLNGPAAIALEAGCDGVHLTGSAPSGAAAEARALFASAGRTAFLGQSCHTVEEVAAAEADLLLFAPVFEKSLEREGAGRIAGAGLAALSLAARAARPRPLLALGGVTLENAPACLAAGAAGIAAIRLFAGEDWRRLRG